MYLEACRFLWVFSDGTGEDAEIAAAIRAAIPEIGQRRPNYVTIEAMYWRKANAIHKWFVDNVQDGEDDCGHYSVGRTQLAELRDLCQQVLDNPEQASALLPTQSGFFFGGTDYDSWYFNDLKTTVEGLTTLLNDTGLEKWDLYYHSSW